MFHTWGEATLRWIAPVILRGVFTRLTRIKNNTLSPDGHFIWWEGAWRTLEGASWFGPTVVQHLSTPSTQDAKTGGSALNGPPNWIIRLQHPTLPGNAIAVAATCANAGNAITLTATSDVGSPTWTNGPAQNNTTDQLQARSFYLLNAPAGTRVITITASTSGAGFPEYWSAVATEIAGVSTTTADGTGVSAQNASSSSFTCSLTTTVDGDFVWCWAVDTGGGYPETITKQAGFTLWSVDSHAVPGTAVQAQVQGSHGTNTVGVTSTATTRYIAFAIAFPAANAGTLPPQDRPRILRMLQYWVLDGTTAVTHQTPFTADTQLWCIHGTQATTITGDSLGNGYQVIPRDIDPTATIQAQYYVRFGASPVSDSATTSFTWPASTNAINCTLLDILYADGRALHQWVSSGGVSGTLGTFTAESIAPYVENAMVIWTGDHNTCSVLDLQGTGYYFLFPTWTGQDEGGGTGDNGMADKCCQDAQLGWAYSQGPRVILTPVFTISGGGGTGIGNWTNTAIVIPGAVQSHKLPDAGGRLALAALSAEDDPGGW